MAEIAAAEGIRSEAMNAFVELMTKKAWLGWLFAAIPAIRDRALADPTFLFKLGVEVFGDLGSCVDVIVVGVRAHDGLERAVTNGANDGFVVVCTIKHDTLSIVADDPHIVVDVEVFAIKRKDARGGQMVDGSHASTLVS